jgi:thiol-disulfide isomerase/thioredoxin
MDTPNWIRLSLRLLIKRGAQISRQWFVRPRAAAKGAEVPRRGRPMRLLWVWFLALLAFPAVHTGSSLPWAANASAPASAAPETQATPARRGAKWHGPLAGVIDRLDWVGDRRVHATDLAGKVVIVEFWTFECVNCKRSLPAVHTLASRYRGSDVQLIGIHTPELERERDPAGVAQAVERDSIDYPVALDPDGEAWEAIGNRYWPCFYVLDRNGKVSYQHVGELHQGTPGWDEFVKRVEAARSVAG